MSCSRNGLTFRYVSASAPQHDRQTFKTIDMDAFTKGVLLPFLIVLGTLASCLLSVSLYHLLKYRKERRDYIKKCEELNSNHAPGSSDEADEDENAQLLGKPSLKRNLSLASSILSSSSEPRDYTTVGDIQEYLHVRDMELHAVYNYSKGYFQLSSSKLILYPLPKSVGKNFTLQYKVSFSFEDSPTFESEARPLRNTTRFDETYRVYCPMSDIEDAEMKFDVSLVDTAFNRSFFSTVGYLLKPSHNANNQPVNGAFRENTEFWHHTDQLYNVVCIRKANEVEEVPEILVSLCYKPTSGRIHVKLIRGRHFLATAHDMVIRVTMLQTRHGSSRSSITAVMGNCTNPDIGEDFTFGIPIANVQTAVLLISLSYGVEGRSFAPIAEASIGELVSSEPGQQHWTDMLSSVRTAVEAWHKLT